jgi:hypothetical protein
MYRHCPIHCLNEEKCNVIASNLTKIFFLTLLKDGITVFSVYNAALGPIYENQPAKNRTRIYPITCI